MFFAHCLCPINHTKWPGLRQLPKPERYINNILWSTCFELIGVQNNYSQKSDYIVTLLFLLYNFLLLHRSCFSTFILRPFQWIVCVLLYINLQENNDTKHIRVLCFDIFISKHKLLLSCHLRTKAFNSSAFRSKRILSSQLLQMIANSGGLNSLPLNLNYYQPVQVDCKVNFQNQWNYECTW